MGDSDRVQQILLNLVSNAVKFTPPGGVVTLSADAPEHEAGLLFLRVSDTGPGIPAEAQRTIFEPFKQLPGSPKGAEGVGLGLTISRTLSRLAGGDVTVESEPGKGATFTVTMPRAANSQD
jgi:signal transduction histidine kinase